MVACPVVCIHPTRDEAAFTREVQVCGGLMPLASNHSEGCIEVKR